MNLKAVLRSVKSFFSQTPSGIEQALDDIKSQVEVKEAGSCMTCRADQKSTSTILVSGKRARTAAIHTKAVRGIRELDVSQPGVPKPEDFPKPISLSHAAPVFQVSSSLPPSRLTASPVMSQASTVNQDRSPMSAGSASRSSTPSPPRVMGRSVSWPEQLSSNTFGEIIAPPFLKATPEAPPPALFSAGTPPLPSLPRAPTYFTAFAETPPVSGPSFHKATAGIPPLSHLRTELSPSPSPVHTPTKSKNSPPFVFKTPPSTVFQSPPLDLERKCTSCAARVDLDADVCEICGEDISASIPSVLVQTNVLAPPAPIKSATYSRGGGYSNTGTVFHRNNAYNNLDLISRRPKEVECASCGSVVDGAAKCCDICGERIMSEEARERERAFERAVRYVPEPFDKEKVKPIVWSVGQFEFKGPDGVRRKLQIPVPDKPENGGWM